MRYDSLFMDIATQGIDPSSVAGILLITFGIVFSIGLPLLLILKGKKD